MLYTNTFLAVEFNFSFDRESFVGTAANAAANATRYTLERAIDDTSLVVKKAIDVAESIIDLGRSCRPALQEAIGANLSREEEVVRVASTAVIRGTIKRYQVVVINFKHTVNPWVDRLIIEPWRQHLLGVKTFISRCNGTQVMLPCPPQVELGAMTIRELKALAKERRLHRYGRLTKAALIRRLVRGGMNSESVG